MIETSNSFRKHQFKDIHLNRKITKHVFSQYKCLIAQMTMITAHNHSNVFITMSEPLRPL